MAPSKAPEIGIWIVPTSAMARLALTHCNLSEEEFAHARMLRRDSDRVRYVAVRSLLRLALSYSVNDEIEAGRWQLEDNGFGKPVLLPEQASLSFSVTHAGAFSVIAITREATIGIDAEKVDATRLKYLPFNCFSPREQRHLCDLPESRRHLDFFRLWTLKEAYTKALGLGFSAEFDRIEFELDPISLRQKAPQAGSQDTESFDLVSISFEGDSYFLATCLLNATPGGTLKKSIFVVS